jgi:hypothetical protein
MPEPMPPELVSSSTAAMEPDRSALPVKSNEVQKREAWAPFSNIWAATGVILALP